MVVPNGRNGIDTTSLPLLISADSNSDTSVTDLTGHDETTVRGIYADKFVRNDPTSVLTNPTSWLARVFGGLGGGIPALILSMIGKIATAVGGLESNIADAWAQIQKFGGIIVQIIQQLEETPLLAPVDLLGAVWFWVGGLWNTVLQSVSHQNPAVASHENRIAAAEAALAALGEPSRGDNFNDPALTKWGVIGAFPKIQAPQGYVAKSSTFRAGEFTASNPTTTKYKVQANIVDLGYGRSRIIAQSNSGFTNFVAVEVAREFPWAIIRLGTASTLNGNLAVEDDHYIPIGGLKNADVIGILVDETTHTFTALWNNNPVCTWEDSAATIGTGSTHRHLALCTNISSNGTFPGSGWEVFSQADIT